MSDILAKEVDGLPATVAYGPGAIRQLPGLVGDLRAQRLLLVCGPRSFEASGAAAILPELRAQAAVHRFSDYSPNTSLDDLAAGRRALEEAQADVVVAIGGGSAMDLAKLLCAFEAEDDVRSRIEAAAPIDTRQTRLILAPTTSGSGSEATHFAVVYVGQRKHSIAGPAMLPDRVVLDPELTRSASAYQRATSGIDAVCQALESLWATAATDESRDLARRGAALVLGHIEPFVEHASSASAAAMSLGSHLAGRAINMTKTTGPHAMSYGLTMRHGIPHGHAVALTFGAFLEVHANAGPERLQEGVDAGAHRAVMAEIATMLDARDGAGARRRFTELLVRLGLEPRPGELGVAGRDEYDHLAASVNTERLDNNPVALDQGDLVQLLASTNAEPDD